MPSVVNKYGEAAEIHAPELDVLTQLADEVRFLPISDARAVIIAMLCSWGQFRKEDLAMVFYTVAGHVSRQRRQGESLIRDILTRDPNTVPTRKVMTRPKRRVAPRTVPVAKKAKKTPQYVTLTLPGF